MPARGRGASNGPSARPESYERGEIYEMKFFLNTEHGLS